MSTSGVSNIKQIPDLVNLIYSEAKEGNILDIGCGRGILGYLLKVLHPGRFTLTGIDPGIPPKVYETVMKVYDWIYEIDVDAFIDEILPTISVPYITVANHIFEHIHKDRALQIINRLKIISNIIILGFPNPITGYKYNLFSKDYHTHKWGATPDIMFSINFKKVTEIKGNQVFIWK